MKIKERLIKLRLFNSSCILCDSDVDGKVSLCKACRNDMPTVDFACTRCALPLDYFLNINSEKRLCGECLSERRFVDYAYNLYHYAAPVDYLISQMKFQQQLSVVAILADLLEAYVDKVGLSHGYPDAFLPVPLHNKRLSKRGFNQSLEIIKPLAKAKNIPILLDVVSRAVATKPQTNLNKPQRQKNISGSFNLLKTPKHFHIIIVDDVVTTGATTNELAKLLKNAGVEKVGVLSLARAELL